MANFVKNPSLNDKFFYYLSDRIKDYGIKKTEQQLKNSPGLKLEADLHFIYPFTMVFGGEVGLDYEFHQWITDESNKGHDVTLGELVKNIDNHVKVG